MARWAWACALALVLMGSSAPALQFIEGESAALRWAPASGPVDSYGVWIRRAGEPWADLPDLWVAAPEVTVYAETNDLIWVRVAAFDADGRQGPFSPESEEIVFMAPPVLPEPARVADFDGDGVSDLVFRSWQRAEVLVVLMGEGFVPRSWGSLYLAANRDVVGSGDFDADGKADLLVRGPHPSQHEIWLMDGSERREQRTLPLPDFGSVEALGDVDGDGHTDLIWRQGPLVLASLLRGAAVVRDIALAVTELEGTAAPDLDGDGLADVYLHDAEQRRSQAWLLNGRHVVGFGDVGAPPWSNAELVGEGDIDGDADDDLLWLRPGSGGLRLWFMDGLETTPVRAWTFSDRQHAEALGDYDGDGKVDEVLIRDVATGEMWIGEFEWDGSSETAPPRLRSFVTLDPFYWEPLGF